jgi:hypothetical protein
MRGADLRGRGDGFLLSDQSVRDDRYGLIAGFCRAIFAAWGAPPSGKRRLLATFNLVSLAGVTIVSIGHQ